MNVARIWGAWALATTIMASTVAVASVDIPHRGIWIFVLAALEITVVFLGFIQLQHSNALVRLFALGAVFWLVLMFGIGLIELNTR